MAVSVLDSTGFLIFRHDVIYVAFVFERLLGARFFAQMSLDSGKRAFGFFCIHFWSILFLKAS